MSTDQDQRQAIEPESASPLTNPRFLVGGGIAAVFVIFILSNLEEVEIDFLWMSVTTNLIWALAISFAFGAVSFWGFSAIRARGARKREEMLAKAKLDKDKK